MSTKDKDYESIYEELIGFVPPRIVQRLRLERECDPDLLDVIEELRKRAMYPDSMDVKQAQLILFAVLISHLAPAAELHARAAVRAGATKKELHDTVALAFLFRGLSAFNMGAEIINKVCDDMKSGAL